MILKFFFRRMSLQTQVRYLKKKGILIGMRVKEGRRVYTYMLGDLFVEVLFKGDNTQNEAEKLTILHGLDKLNHHMEKEFRTSF